MAALGTAMDPVQRAFARSLKALMAKYPTVESAREAQGANRPKQTPVPHETRQELAQKGA